MCFLNFTISYFCNLSISRASSLTSFWLLFGFLGSLCTPLCLSLVHPGPPLAPSWAHLGLLGASLETSLAYFGHHWAHMDAPLNPHGSIWNILKPHGSFLSPEMSLEPFGNPKLSNVSQPAATRAQNWTCGCSNLL